MELKIFFWSNEKLYDYESRNWFKKLELHNKICRSKSVGTQNKFFSNKDSKQTKRSITRTNLQSRKKTLDRLRNSSSLKDPILNSEWKSAKQTRCVCRREEQKFTFGTRQHKYPARKVRKRKVWNNMTMSENSFGEKVKFNFMKFRSTSRKHEKQIIIGLKAAESRWRFSLELRAWLFGNQGGEFLSKWKNS